MGRPVTSSELRDILVRHIVRANGGGITKWRRAIGRMRTYSLATHAHCNWEVSPLGTPQENHVIERAVDEIRPDYPFVDLE